jgi:hypothetical protein
VNGPAVLVCDAGPRARLGADAAFCSGAMPEAAVGAQEAEALGPLELDGLVFAVRDIGERVGVTTPSISHDSSAA